MGRANDVGSRVHEQQARDRDGRALAGFRVWAAAIWVVLAACFAACTQNSVPIPVASTANQSHVEMPGPAPRGRDAASASASNATCTTCHTEIAAEWRASFHARSQRDEAYQRAFALEPLPFCQGCHAPEADAFKPVPELAAELGVGCVTCHVTGDHVLAIAREAFAAQAPHAVTRAAEFAGVGACAKCHEFAFPDVALRGKPELMQATVSEHAHSTASGAACASCHMPSVGAGQARHRSHAFPGGHAPDFVKSALRVRAERRADTRVHLVLESEGVGHAFPTGDLFRRLEVSAEAVGSDFQVVSSAQRFLSRHWSEERKLATVVRRVIKDDRASGAPLEVELELDASVGSLPLAWRVAYQRVEHPRSEAEQDSVLDGEIEIASGTLPPLSKGANHHVHP